MYVGKRERRGILRHMIDRTRVLVDCLSALLISCRDDSKQDSFVAVKGRFAVTGIMHNIRR